MESAEPQIFVPGFSQGWDYPGDIFQVVPLPSPSGSHQTALAGSQDHPGLLSSSQPHPPQPSPPTLPRRGLGLSLQAAAAASAGAQLLPEQAEQGRLEEGGGTPVRLRPLHRGVCALRSLAPVLRREKGGSAPQVVSGQPGRGGESRWLRDGLCHTPPQSPSAG